MPQLIAEAIERLKIHVDEAIALLQAESRLIQRHRNVMYIDKLDGTVEMWFYEQKKMTGWRELAAIQRKLAKYFSADACYIDEGI